MPTAPSPYSHATLVSHRRLLCSLYTFQTRAVLSRCLRFPYTLVSLLRATVILFLYPELDISRHSLTSSRSSHLPSSAPLYLDLVSRCSGATAFPPQEPSSSNNISYGLPRPPANDRSLDIPSPGVLAHSSWRIVYYTHSVRQTAAAFLMIY